MSTASSHPATKPSSFDPVSPSGTAKRDRRTDDIWAALDAGESVTSAPGPAGAASSGHTAPALALALSDDDDDDDADIEAAINVTSSRPPPAAHAVTVTFTRVCPSVKHAGPFHVKAETCTDSATKVSGAVKSDRMPCPPLPAPQVLQPPVSLRCPAASKSECLTLRLKRSATPRSVELGRASIPLRWLRRNTDTRFSVRFSNGGGSADIVVNPGDAGGIDGDVIPAELLQPLVSLTSVPIHVDGQRVGPLAVTHHAASDSAADFLERVRQHLGNAIGRTTASSLDALRVYMVDVLGCDGLPKMDTFGTCDCYAVLQPSGAADTNVAAGTRTRTFKNSLTPAYDEPPLVCVSDRGCVLTLWDQDTMTKDESLGFLDVSAAAAALYPLPDAAPSPVMRVPIVLRKPASDGTASLSASFTALLSKASDKAEAAGHVRLRLSSVSVADLLDRCTHTCASQEMTRLSAARDPLSADSAADRRIRILAAFRDRSAPPLRPRRPAPGPHRDQNAVGYWLDRVDATMAHYRVEGREKLLQLVLPLLADPERGGWKHGAMQRVRELTYKWGDEPKRYAAPPAEPAVSSVAPPSVPTATDFDEL